MRKTSGFFRKTFGNNSRDQGISSTGNGYVRGSGLGSISAPTTPTSSRFPSNGYSSGTQPPVPSIPSAYATQNSQVAPSTPPRASMDSNAYRTNALRHGSVSSYNTASPPAMNARPMSSSGSTKSPSTSLGRISSFAASFRTSHSTNSATDLSGNGLDRTASGMKASSSSGTSEHDRLAKELHQWQLTEERMEDMIDQNGSRSDAPGSARPYANDDAGDYSTSTIKGRNHSSARNTPRTPAQQTFGSPKAKSPRTPQSSERSPVFVSGSIPSPQRGMRPSRDFGGSVGSGNGSEPSARTGQDRRLGSTSTDTSSTSTATDETSRQRLVPQAREDRPATGGSTPKPSSGLVNPNSSSFWLDSSSSSAAEDDPNGKPSPSLASDDGQSPALPAKERMVLTPSSGKQIRKRVPSNVQPSVESRQAEAGSQTPGIRLVSSPNSQKTENEQSREIEGESDNAGLGLGIGLPRNPASIPNQTGTPSIGSHTNTTSPKTTSSPQFIALPRLTTQSPSPARQQVPSSLLNGSPAGSPSRQTVNSGSVSMYPVGSGSPSARNVSSSIPGKRSSSGLRTPILGLPEGDNETPATQNGSSPLATSIVERARVFAERCWSEDESFLKKEKIAEWLGGTGELNQYALKFYMDNLDFRGLRLDNAFR